MAQPRAQRESLREVYLNRRMPALLGLGFASGLPYMLTQDSMVAWLSDRGIDPKQIGLFALVTLPYSLKFLWAPAMDRWTPPGLGGLGRRRGWLLVTQVLCMITIAAMALASPDQSVWTFAAFALAVAFASASQDIVADAYRTDVLPDAELGVGAAVHVWGYRVAMIVSGGAALVVAERVGWRQAYLMMAGLMGVGMVAALLAPAPPGQHGAPATLASAVVEPFEEFLRRNGRRAVLVLAFILLFKLPDVTAGWQTMPFLLKELAFSMTDVGVVRQWLGLAITIVGALVGGGVVARLGVLRSLWVIGVLQAVSNAGFLALAMLGVGYAHRYGAMVGVIAVESFCAGLVTAGFVAFLMSECDRRYSATQYALLTSLMALTGVLFRTPTGYLVDYLGWPGFFAATMALGIPGMLLLIWMPERRRPADPWLCHACAYDLRGTPGPACPECGALIPAEQRALIAQPPGLPAS